MTEAEELLWTNLRRKQLKGLQFYRQKPLGEYIVDFYCPRAKLVIELDGGQHYSKEGMIKDMERDNYIKGMGLNILRFSDRDIFENLRGVLEKIWSCL